MIVFLDDSTFTGRPQSEFVICEDDIYERKVNLNALKGAKNISVDKLKKCRQIKSQQVDIDSNESLSDKGGANDFSPRKFEGKHSKAQRILKLPYTEFHTRITKRKIDEMKILVGPKPIRKSDSTKVTAKTKLSQHEDWIAKQVEM